LIFKKKKHDFSEDHVVDNENYDLWLKKP
jgi:hypothetical protein